MGFDGYEKYNQGKIYRDKQNTQFCQGNQKRPRNDYKSFRPLCNGNLWSKLKFKAGKEINYDIRWSIFDGNGFCIPENKEIFVN